MKLTASKEGTLDTQRMTMIGRDVFQVSVTTSKSSCLTFNYPVTNIAMQYEYLNLHVQLAEIAVDKLISICVPGSNIVEGVASIQTYLLG